MSNSGSSKTSLHRRSTLLWITTFGLGYMRPASGTWGSLPPAVIGAAMCLARAGPAEHPWLFNGVLLTILVVFSAACIVQGDAAEARFQKKDPGQVVADETAGQCLPLLFLPASAFTSGVRALVIVLGAFLLFRILDILKPWPAYRLQRIPGGWGILIDDLLAGLYAAAVMQVVLRLNLGL